MIKKKIVTLFSFFNLKHSLTRDIYGFNWFKIMTACHTQRWKTPYFGSTLYLKNRNDNSAHRLKKRFFSLSSHFLAINILLILYSITCTIRRFYEVQIGGGVTPRHKVSCTRNCTNSCNVTFG
jgi:hypothetical protein